MAGNKKQKELGRREFTWSQPATRDRRTRNPESKPGGTWARIIYIYHWTTQNKFVSFNLGNIIDTLCVIIVFRSWDANYIILQWLKNNYCVQWNNFSFYTSFVIRNNGTQRKVVSRQFNGKRAILLKKFLCISLHFASVKVKNKHNL